jgi:predicted TIM-barrel fold metal-dependent hydrolase
MRVTNTLPLRRPVFLPVEAVNICLYTLKAEHPDTPAVLDHFCRIGLGGVLPEVQMAQLCALAKYPQLYIKLSAFYALGQATPPYDDMLPFVERLVKAYGSVRCLR